MNDSHQEQMFLSLFPQRPGRLCGPPSLLSNGLFPSQDYKDNDFRLELTVGTPTCLYSLMPY